MNFDPVIRVLQVFFAVLIAVVPLFYPRHSLYYRRAIKGIEQLRKTPHSVIVSDGNDASTYDLNGECLDIDEHSKMCTAGTNVHMSRINRDSIPDSIVADSYDLYVGETGFSELVRAFKNEGVESGLFWSDIDWDKVQRIRMVKGPASVVRGLHERDDMGDLADPNAVLVVEYSDASHKLLLLNPLHPTPVKEHVYLRQWVAARSRERALRATAVLAISYTVFSLLLV
jgi:hypothetical protein